MSGDTFVTVIGNLTAAPELRFTAAGTAVANFSVASTPRLFDRNTNEWKDGETLFMRCTVWREAAENAAETLSRGSRVIVSGRLKQRNYETREGDKRTTVELEVDEVAASLRFATAKITRISRNGGGAVAGTVDDDPWNSAPTREPALAGAATAAFRGSSDEPPF